MITLLIDHNTFDRARRALLISAAVTIFLASTKIFGGTLSIAGLEIGIDREHLLISARILTAYFLYVFFCFSLSHFGVGYSKTARRRAERSKLGSQRRAKEADDEYASAQDADQSFDYNSEPWWDDHIKNEFNQDKIISRADSAKVIVLVARLIATNFVPPSVIGFGAVFYPEYIAGLLYQ